MFQFVTTHFREMGANVIFLSSVGEVWQKPRYEIGEVLIFAPGVEEEVAAAILVPFRAVGLRVFVHVWGGAPLWRLLATPTHPIQNVGYLLLVLLPVNVFCTPDIMVGCNTNFRKCAKLRMTISTTSYKNSVALVRERTIPTERPPPVGEVSANFLRIEGCHVVSATSPHGR